MNPLLNPRVGPWIVALIAAAVATFCVLLAVHMLRRTAERRRLWHRVEGEVIGYVWDSGGSNSLQYWKLRWTGADGCVRECLSAYGTSWGTLRPFPFKAALLVDPEDPNRAQVADNLARNGNLVSVLLLLVAAIGVVVALWMVTNGLSHMADSPAL